MKYILIVLFLLCVSCTDKKEETAEVATSSEVEVIPTNESAFINKDSLLLDSKGISADKIVITEIKRSYDKDSIGTAFFEIGFFKNNKAIYTYPTKIVFGMDEGAEWNINQEFMSDSENENIDTRFIHCNYGIAACGYTHNHFLFFLDEKGVQLVTQWDSMWDGGYGVDQRFEPDFKTKPMRSFFARTIDVSSDETVNDSIERVEVSYTDSVRYNFENGKWKKIQLTQKGKIYRKENFTFEEYYKQ
ncbi:hypothetical protein [uncultured Flavobacterium sp.]|uniref:hypothetical protein n=1 Tax=uncultured Flavobacterium sp. TaxID=165435 RepID=UPI00121282EF|nr:hypothetical protein [uncultured Flavobacterium sp.]THD32732.1 MAG: hypothetical protein DI588_05795 [Flavobacterium johnsoniae]